MAVAQRSDPNSPPCRVLQLRGSSACSPFRLGQLQNELKHSLTDFEIAYAEYWHFVAISESLSPDQEAVLASILQYGSVGRVPDKNNLLPVLIVPRVGTISPWSTKATEIARRCGLDPVQRIERGVAWWLAANREGSPAPQKIAEVRESLCDPMIESVLESFDAVDQLFEQVRPEPLQFVDVVTGGIGELRQANQAWGNGIVRGRNRVFVSGIFKSRPQSNGR